MPWVYIALNVWFFSWSRFSHFMLRYPNPLSGRQEQVISHAVGAIVRLRWRDEIISGEKWSCILLLFPPEHLSLPLSLQVLPYNYKKTHCFIHGLPLWIHRLNVFDLVTSMFYQFISRIQFRSVQFQWNLLILTWLWVCIYFHLSSLSVSSACFSKEGNNNSPKVKRNWRAFLKGTEKQFHLWSGHVNNTVDNKLS